MRRGAPLRPLVDETPLHGPRIDVAVRIGWTLRMARLLAEGAPTLQQVADQVGTGLTAVHRAETGASRSGALADGYEQVLGLPRGSLRAPVDVVAASFHYAPPDRDPGTAPTSVAAMSDLIEVVDGGDPDGGDWMAWARAMSQTNAIGLPMRMAHEIVSRLVGELNRSVGHAYPSRYAAISRLRTGPYGAVVLDVVREQMSDPFVQRPLDMMSAVGESADVESRDWSVGLLADPREQAVAGGAVALENMAATSGCPDFWGPLYDRLVTIHDDADDGGAAWRWRSHLLRLVPREVRVAAGRLPRRPLAPATATPDDVDPAERDDWAQASTLALALTEQAGIGHQPVLARILHDVLFSPHETRAVTGYMLLGAVPAISSGVPDLAAEIAVTHVDPVVRERVRHRLVGLAQTLPYDVRTTALPLRAAGATGVRLPERDLEHAIERGEVDDAMYAAGMAGHPFLERAAADVRASSQVRGAARWWLREGARITD
jgi:hypothetical protein